MFIRGARTRIQGWKGGGKGKWDRGEMAPFILKKPIFNAPTGLVRQLYPNARETELHPEDLAKTGAPGPAWRQGRF